ncbi:HET-domain-containing protein [Xylaria longipes]|nr:HET-domain-containing protein [Xylaria longipes]
MRLLDTTTLKLKTFIGDQKPEYAILSHTWGDDEVLFEDIQNKSIERWKVKAGADKVVKSAKIAAKLGIAYIWIDTCCIDKSSSSELSEAINSMFKWYRDSHICYAYLSDVHSEGMENRENGIVPFEYSRWFRRGWTLQELIAPANMQFFDKAYSVHTKMVWASRRTTTRAEDRAYSLMGLFDVNMPLLYGEGGERAFERLQDEIIKRTNDQSILLHGSKHYINHLAKSPDDFTSFYKFMKSERDYDLPFQKTSDGIDVSLGLCPTRHGGLFWGIIEAHFRDDPLQLDRPAFQLNCVGRLLYRRTGDEI